MRITPCLLFACLALAAAPLTGCGKADADTSQADAHDHGHEHGHSHGHGHDHDHGDRPKSLHAAVAELTEMRNTIEEAILAGDMSKAHGPLHEVGELLEAIPDLASETDLPKEEWDAVKAATEELFDAFGEIDKAFHTKDGDKKAAYEGVADKLHQALKAIRSRLPLTGEDPEAAHEDHDHEDHEGHDHDHDHGEDAS